MEVDKPVELDEPTLANDDVPMETAGGAGKSLKEWTDERRIELGLKLADVAAEAGLTEEGLRKATNGERSPRQATRRKIEQALRWTRHSVDQILAGGEPTPLPDTAELPRTAEELASALLDHVDSPEDAYDAIAEALRRRRRSRGTEGGDVVAGG